MLSCLAKKKNGITSLVSIMNLLAHNPTGTVVVLLRLTPQVLVVRSVVFQPRHLIRQLVAQPVVQAGAVHLAEEAVAVAVAAVKDFRYNKNSFE